jgi:catechol 2,3-dioxygenase-like lactoylglutathione lyase family enzyme
MEAASMDNLDARAVFFVRDAGRALAFYTQQLGFSLDWTHEEGGRPFVFQVSLFGFRLILNQEESWTKDRAGHGRVFIGLDDDQAEPFGRHLEQHRIETTVLRWGAPTLVVHDLDRNELFFWLPENDRPNLEARHVEAGPA